MDILIFVCQIIILALVMVIFIKSIIKGDPQDTIISSMKDYFKIFQDSINRINEHTITEIPKIESSISLVANVLERVEYKMDTCLPIKSTSPICLDDIIGLTDFEIYYFSPYDGYLSIDADYCEIRFLDESQIIIKKHLKNFFLKAKQTISIRNMKNLKNIHFVKK